ncbi:MAG: hypothetical protein AAFU85_17870 [Planctomycetota bacterium]
MLAELVYAYSDRFFIKSVDRIIALIELDVDGVNFRVNFDDPQYRELAAKQSRELFQFIEAVSHSPGCLSCVAPTAKLFSKLLRSASRTLDDTTKPIQQIDGHSALTEVIVRLKEVKSTLVLLEDIAALIKTQDPLSDDVMTRIRARFPDTSIGIEPPEYKVGLNAQGEELTVRGDLSETFVSVQGAAATLRLSKTGFNQNDELRTLKQDLKRYPTENGKQVRKVCQLSKINEFAAREGKTLDYSEFGRDSLQLFKESDLEFKRM